MSAWVALAMRLRLRKAVGALVPRGYDDLRARRGRDHVLAMRDRRMATGRAALAARAGVTFSVEESARFLAARGLDADQVRDGSVPQASLDYAGSLVASELPRDRPLLALHIGNFVGVSLAYLSALLTDRHPGSRVVSIDPNVVHRGVEDPAGHVFALLDHFGLLAGNLVITGYTLEQNVNEEYELDPAVSYEAERRPEHVLRSLAAWTGKPFDVVFIDGNHDGRYLEREIAQLRQLLRPSGLLILDDVDEAAWRMVAEIFDRLASDEAFEELGRDGRLGVLRMSRPS